jgi:hypothetical protein
MILWNYKFYYVNTYNILSFTKKYDKILCKNKNFLHISNIYLILKFIL